MTEEEIKNLKFMSIGSNCYGIAYMGEQRVRGPIDNVLALKGLSSSISLFEGTLENEILNTTPKVYDKTNPSQFDVNFKYENGKISASVDEPYSDKSIDFGIAKLHFVIGTRAKGINGKWSLENVFEVSEPQRLKFEPKENNDEYIRNIKG